MNVLVYAHRKDTPEHEQIGAWLESAVNASAPFGLSTLVLGGMLRIVTHSRVFAQPTPIATAVKFLESLRARPNCVEVRPGARHWDIFADLCRATGATGNLVPDAYLAALAIESGSEWVTTDGGFARYPGLRCLHPLA
ncbi:MAG TPA: type II toxin-antitoxin system VapC family toxin [Solirubrobacteraceae bacterium]